MTRQANYIRVALFVAAVTFPVLVWPRTMQPNTGQCSTESAKICLGNVQISKDKEAVLADIEKVLSDKKKWPRTQKEIENLQERLKGVINSLSPSVQEQTLPRLVPRRWEIQALWLLASESPPTDSDINAIRTLADEINLLRINPPSDVAVDLMQELIKKEKELRDKSETLERTLAIKQGKDALGGKDAHGIELAMRQLQGFEDGESKKLVYQLGLLREIVFAASDLNQFKIMKASKLKDYGLAKLSQGLIDLQLRVALNSNKYGVPDSRTELIDLEKQEPLAKPPLRF
jgi:hypothetical protein